MHEHLENGGVQQKTITAWAYLKDADKPTRHLMQHDIYGKHGNTRKTEAADLATGSGVCMARQRLKNRGGPPNATKTYVWKAWKRLKIGGKPPNATENNLPTAQDRLKNRGEPLNAT